MPGRKRRRRRWRKLGQEDRSGINPHCWPACGKRKPIKKKKNNKQQEQNCYRAVVECLEVTEETKDLLQRAEESELIEE